MSGRTRTEKRCSHHFSVVLMTVEQKGVRFVRKQLRKL